MRTTRNRGLFIVSATKSVALLSLVLLIATMATPVGAAGGANGVPGRSVAMAEAIAGLPDASLEPAPTAVARRSEHVALNSGVLRQTVIEAESTSGSISDDKGTRSVIVEVITQPMAAELRSLVTALGGSVVGSAGSHVLEASMPVDRLVDLEADERVTMVRPPLVASFPIEHLASQADSVLDVVGEEVDKIGADAWHAAGHAGMGVAVGIIDSFDGALWSAAQAAGELPPPSGTHCERKGSPCDVWLGGDHGVAVAEVVHEVAPSAQLYLSAGASAIFDYSASDMQAAVDFFAAQGVSIISHSATAEFDGPGDGTGPLAEVIDDAVSKGMNWFNSAGNTAGDDDHYGEYWRGVWKDDDGDSWLEFEGTTEALIFDSCGFVNGLRWSDWGEAGATDYDVYVFDTVDDLYDPTRARAFGEDDQIGGAPPVEHLYMQLPSCAEGEYDLDYLQVRVYNPGAGTAGDVIEFKLNNSVVTPWNNPSSASGPFSDTESPGGLAVGAVDPPGGVLAGYYSAWGPTNSGHIKPDLMAASGFASFTLGTFHGTSAATPAAAGSAALVLGAGLASSPQQLKTYLLSQAVVDRGPGGPDNQYGYGELILPAPPEPAPTLTITNPGAGATVDETVMITAVSTGTVSGVEFAVDGSPIGTDWDGADGWSRSWDTTQYTDGSHTVSVVAVNDGRASDSITVYVDNGVTPPATLTITAPTAGATVAETVTIAAASTGSVDGVRFEVDGSALGFDLTAGDGWSIAWDTTSYHDGVHTISVRATNNATVSDSVAVTVDNPEPITKCRGLPATIVGTSGDDVLYGTDGPDVIQGLGGDDSLYGLGADDVLCGGDGEDFLYGGDGADTLSGDADHDNLNGDDGDDVLLGGPGDDYLSGGLGNDLLRGHLGNDWSWGEEGDDRIQDGPGDDGLDGGPGKDKLWGGIGADSLWGDLGRDQLYGGRDNDYLDGGVDTDRIWGDSGDDNLWGGANSDFLYGGIGDDSLSGEAGNDRLFGWAGSDYLWGGSGRDQLRGQAGDDIVDGGLHYDWCSVETIWMNCEKAL